MPICPYGVGIFGGIGGGPWNFPGIELQQNTHKARMMNIVDVFQVAGLFWAYSRNILHLRNEQTIGKDIMSIYSRTIIPSRTCFSG